MKAEEVRIAVLSAMGWKNLRMHLDTYQGGPFDYLIGEHPNYGTRPPDPTTDERHAFQAVEWMRKTHGVTTMINIYSDGEVNVVFANKDGYGSSNQPSPDKLPLAISEAFCKACGIYVEGQA